MNFRKMKLKIWTKYKKAIQMNGFLIIKSALVGIRTPNLLIRSQVLYPVELQVQRIFLNLRCFWTFKSIHIT
jgi:hypothetical protein